MDIFDFNVFDSINIKKNFFIPMICRMNYHGKLPFWYSTNGSCKLVYLAVDGAVIINVNTHTKKRTTIVILVHAISIRFGIKVYFEVKKMLI